MNYSYLFSKNDAICYAILSALSSRTSLTLTKEEVGKTHGLTNYQLHKYFDQLNADLAEISTETPTYLNEVNNTLWKAFNLNSFALQRIALLYLNRSPLFTALEYRFFYDHLYTKRDYIETSFMSTSYFYRSLDNLEATLTEHHFFDATTLISDPEFTIRLHLFQLYYTMYNSVEAPFADLNDLVKLIIDMITEVLDNPISPTQKTKLSTFLRIWLLRQHNNNFIDQAGTLNLPQLTTATTLFDQLSALLHDEIKLSQVEFDYLMAFLVTQGFFGKSQQNQAAETLPTVTKLSNQFMSALLNENILLKTSLINGDALWQSLQTIHLQFTTFYIEPTTFINPKQIQFFADLYPAFDVTVDHMINYLHRQEDLHVTKAMAINLYFSYMFALINAIPAALLRDQIHICVDFSQGTLYTDYVIQSLTAFNHAHLVIDQVVDANTDIYISDFHSPEVVPPQVIWQDPPTAADWSQLADLILAVKHQKLTEYFPNHDASSEGGPLND